MAKRISELEEVFNLQLRQAKLPTAEREYKFHDTRKWKFDFAYPEKMIAIEIEGGVWMKKSRHISGVGFIKDCEKYNTATSLGWRVFRFTKESIIDYSAINMIKAVLDEKDRA